MLLDVPSKDFAHQVVNISNHCKTCCVPNGLKLEWFTSRLDIGCVSLDLNQHNRSIFIKGDQVATSSSSVDYLLTHYQQCLRFLKDKLNIFAEEFFDVTFGKAEIRKRHVFNFVFTEMQAIGKLDWNKHFFVFRAIS